MSQYVGLQERILSLNVWRVIHKGQTSLDAYVEHLCTDELQLAAQMVVVDVRDCHDQYIFEDI